MCHNYDPYYVAYMYAYSKINIYTNYTHIFSVYNFYIYTHSHYLPITKPRFITSMHIYHTIYYTTKYEIV